jgi:GNAT superfamily N-acetyltransferase
MPALGNMIRWGKECARTGPWPADSSVAFLVPVPDGATASAEFVRRCLSLLAEQGYQSVVTAALSPDEQRGFLDAGFSVHEHLHLLILDKTTTLPPIPPGPRIRRAGALRRRGLLKVDAAAFAPFWRLDRAGLRDAMGATQHRHLRVVLGVRHKVVGYAVCGASGGRGFVQRLAVLPEAQGHGIGKRLLLDGLHWLRGLNAHHIVVNTQVGNEAALALYRQVGFRDDPAGLSVLSAGLSRP